MVNIKNNYTLPKFDDLFDHLNGEIFFFMIELWYGYHQFRWKKLTFQRGIKLVVLVKRFL